MYKFAYLNGIPFQIRNIFKYLGKYLPEYLPGYGFLQRVGYNGLSLYQDMISCFSIHERERLYTEDIKPHSFCKSPIVFIISTSSHNKILLIR